jgi:hypothetical protein
MSDSAPITVAYGDGIGPEIMDKTETLRNFNGDAGYTLSQGQ